MDEQRWRELQQELRHQDDLVLELRDDLQQQLYRMAERIRREAQRQVPRSYRWATPLRPAPLTPDGAHVITSASPCITPEEGAGR